MKGSGTCNQRANLSVSEIDKHPLDNATLSTKHISYSKDMKIMYEKEDKGWSFQFIDNDEYKLLSKNCGSIANGHIPIADKYSTIIFNRKSCHYFASKKEAYEEICYLYKKSSTYLSLPSEEIAIMNGHFYPGYENFLVLPSLKKNPKWIIDYDGGDDLATDLYISQFSTLSFDTRTEALTALKYFIKLWEDGKG